MIISFIADLPENLSAPRAGLLKSSVMNSNEDKPNGRL